MKSQIPMQIAQFVSPQRAIPPSSGGHQHSPDEFLEGAAIVDEPIPESSMPFSFVHGNDVCSIAQRSAAAPIIIFNATYSNLLR